MQISIRKRIYWSLFLLVLLFVVSSVVTNITLEKYRKFSMRLREVVDPSLQGLEEFQKMVVESKMYTTNWVFFRYKQEDKDRLKRMHASDYTALKIRISIYSSKWTNKQAVDSLNNIFRRFEQLLAVEKKIMRSLNDFDAYNDPSIKFEAERLLEDEVLPRTNSLIRSLDAIHNRGINIRAEQNALLERSSVKMRIYIIILVLTTIGGSIFLSIYLSRLIIAPVKRINQIIDDLGKGITRKIEDRDKGDEIGKMVCSVNNLSDKLQSTASFAQEVGLRNFDMPFRPLSEEDTLGKALLSMRDNLRMSETILEIKNKELERKNKELEQFAYVASHDLQEPLRTITSFVELFDRQYKGRLDEKADKYINYITQSSNRMKILITDLLEYSRIGSEKELAKVDCNEVIKEVLEDLNMAITESGATIVVDPLPVIIVYPIEMKQVFQNLLVNAIKFRKKDQPPYIRISAKEGRDNWQFEFSDNGIGIAKEHHDRIFIIFQRLHTRNEYPGSGIGLSHCKKIVELHKGRIWLKSSPGEGTSFYFTISQPNT